MNNQRNWNTIKTHYATERIEKQDKLAEVNKNYLY